STNRSGNKPGHDVRTRGNAMNRARNPEQHSHGLLHRSALRSGGKWLPGLFLAWALPLSSLAQAPQFMPADIPLDTGLIFEAKQPEPEYAAITPRIIEQMRRQHYSTIRFDDAYSSTLLDSYIKTLDGSRSLFTQADIDNFQ